LLQQLVSARRWFLLRLPAPAPLYPVGRTAFSRRGEGRAYYWPQQARQAPVLVRVLRLRGHKVVGAKRTTVGLMTNVREPKRWPLALARRFYRWRWRNEGLFRTSKRTLGKVKLLSRTVAPVHREAEGALLALPGLLAQGVWALPPADRAAHRPPSARQVLVALRAEMRNHIGLCLGPRQRHSYRTRLGRIRLERRREQVRRRRPSRHPHQPPQRPRLLRMGTDLKDLVAETFRSG
jgi:hypothetical protein